MMREKSWWVWILVICCLGCVKAGLHMIRLVVVLALGLGGLYMLHLLAQDFNKISHNFRPGRGGALLSALGGASRGRRSLQEPNWIVERLVNDTKEMRQVLKNDPIGCARKYVCHISHKSRAKLTRTQDNVLFLLRTFSWLDVTGEWKKAEEIGKKNKGENVCETAYKKCWYTGAQLDKFMSIL